MTRLDDATGSPRGQSVGAVVVVAATRMETRAARLAVGSRARVARVGVGATRAMPPGPWRAILSVGLCGALGTGLQPGDAVIPDTVGWDGTEPVRCAAALVEALRQAAAALGMCVHEGALATTGRLVTGTERERLASRGYVAADMESALLATHGIPFAAVRVVLDTPHSEIDEAWGRPLVALLQPHLWGQARRLAAAAPAFARRAGSIAAGGIDRLENGGNRTGTGSR